MPLGEIPPWLDINPRDFISAADAGGRLGIEKSDQTQRGQLEQERLAQESSAENMRSNQESANRLLEQQRLVATQQDAASRLALETQAAARKYQAQGAYQKAIQNGTDPIAAMQQFGPQMGESMTGVGALGLEQFRQKQAMMPPQLFNGPDGQPAGATYEGQMHMFPRRPATLPAKMDQIDQADYTNINKQLADIDKQVAAGAGSPNDATVRALRNQRDRLLKEKEEIKGRYQTDDEAGGSEDKADAEVPDSANTPITATNPQTGQKVVYQNGQWQPLQQ